MKQYFQSIKNWLIAFFWIIEEKKQECMQFAPGVLEEIQNTVGARPAESGGVLLGYRDDFVVQQFVFDPYGTMTRGSYYPNVDFLNQVINKAREEHGYEYLGSLHSHPPGCRLLSGIIDEENGRGDLAYIKRIFGAMPSLPKILTPIVQSGADTAFEVIPYVAKRDNPMDYQLVPLEVLTKEITQPAPFDVFTPDMSRLEGAVNLDLMANVHIVCIGAGGANEMYKKLVRCGAQKITVIDFDEVDKSNLHSQGWYIGDIGTAKVDALGKHISNINPNVDYTGYKGDVTKMYPQEYDEIFGTADLIMGMTDNFEAQSFVNKLAIKYNAPAIFAMLYEKAKGMEITFSIPGVTPACHRCATSSRYAAYSNGYINDVTSHGATLFHGDYLNGATGLLALSILHRDEENCELGGWFGDYFDRNLIQLGAHPLYGVGTNGLFDRTYSNLNHAHSFNSVWHQVDAEDAINYDCACPDCFGLGDLRQSSQLVNQIQRDGVVDCEWTRDKRIQPQLF